jgi:hypothetical protein
VVKQHPTWLAWNETGHVPFRIQSAPARFVLLPLTFRFIGHRVLNGFLPGVGRDAECVVKDIASRAPPISPHLVDRS